MATLWRTKPQYRGHVCDGYYQTADGGLRHQPLADPAEARRRVVELIGEPEAPLVSAFAIDGRLPSVGQVAAVEHELHKAPSAIVQDFRARGGKIEVIAGPDARRHPVTSRKSTMNPCGGWCCISYNLICVASEAEGGAPVVLHELAHYWDRSNCGPGRFSGRAAWQAISEFAFSERRFSTSFEKFAEAFALHYHSTATRDRLSDSIQDFIARACE